MWTVILLKGSKKSKIFGPEPKVRAQRRVDDLCELHGLSVSQVTTNDEEQTFTVDASSWYTK